MDANTNSTPQTAVCSKCKREFPFTSEFFCTRKNAPSGLRRLCRKCHSIYGGRAKKQRAALKKQEREKTVPPGFKVCTSCKELLPKTAQYYHPRKGGYFAAKCKKCTQDIHRKAYHENPQRRAGILKRCHDKHFSTYIYKPKRLKTDDEKRATKQRAEARRRTKKHDLPVSFSATDWQKALNYFNNCCAVCGRPPGLWHKIVQDHWNPITLGGGYTPDNIIPLCHGIGGCNNSKWNRDPCEWLIWKFGKNKAIQILRRIREYFDSVH